MSNGNAPGQFEMALPPEHSCLTACAPTRIVARRGYLLLFFAAGLAADGFAVVAGFAAGFAATA